MEGGLRSYVGAANIEDDGGYVGKVLSEHARLQLVAKGQAVPMNGPQTLPASSTQFKPETSNPKVAVLFSF
jgi:hypothetical protein